MLETDKCYMLDCDSEIFVWMGKQTLLTERRTATRAIEVRLSSEFSLFHGNCEYPCFPVSMFYHYLIVKKELGLVY